MPVIGLSLLPQGARFIVRLQPTGGWLASAAGLVAPAPEHVAEALTSRFGFPFAVTQTDTQQQYSDYHFASQDTPLSGDHVARAISNSIQTDIITVDAAVPAVAITVLLSDHMSEPIGYSHTGN
jgi:hypothetical protein